MLACALGACGSEPAPIGVDAGAVESLGPVPAPAGLVLELQIGKPAAFWSRVQKIGGLATVLLPATYPMLVVTLLGAPPSVAGQIDTEVPLLGAIVDPGKGELSAVVGIHVKSGRELVAALSTGQGAPFAAQQDPASGVTLLAAAQAKQADPVLGVVGNWLLVARARAELLSAGPFVARTLPTRPAPSEAASAVIGRQALSGMLPRRLRSAWKESKARLERMDADARAKHGGRAPDFGDPAAALIGIDAAVESLAQLLESSERVRLGLELPTGRAELRLEVEPAASGAARDLVAGMSVGPLDPLLSLPKSTALGLLSRDTREARTAAARAAADALARVLADRLSPADSQKISGAFGDLAAGRGDHVAYGLVLAPQGLVMRGALADAAAFDRGARAALGLGKLHALYEPLRQFVGDFELSHGKLEVPGVGSARRTLVKVKPSPMRAVSGKADAVDLGPRTWELAWIAREGSVLGAAAREAGPLLAELGAGGADPARTLAGDAPVAAAAERAGAEVAFALFAQPLRLGIAPGAAPASAPLLATFGRSSGRASVRVEVVDAALGALATAAVR